MGRGRIRNHHLPKRIYIHHGAYWYYPKDSAPVKLARLDAPIEAIEKYGVELPLFSFDQHAKELFRVLRRSAKSRRIPLAITLEDVLSMLKAANYCCTISGVPFSYERVPGCRVRPWIPSIDRIDSRLGYTVENCRIVCAYINIALNTFGLPVLEKVIKAMRGRRKQLAATIISTSQLV
jgi:hypothetical protein